MVWNAYSMFWTCSRICSMRTFSSTEMRVMSEDTDFEPSVLASRLSSWQRKSRRLPQAPPLSRTRRNSATWAARRSSSSSTSIARGVEHHLLLDALVGGRGGGLREPRGELVAEGLHHLGHQGLRPGHEGGHGFEPLAQHLGELLALAPAGLRELRHGLRGELRRRPRGSWSARHLARRRARRASAAPRHRQGRARPGRRRPPSPRPRRARRAPCASGTRARSPAAAGVKVRRQSTLPRVSPAATASRRTGSSARRSSARRHWNSR